MGIPSPFARYPGWEAWHRSQNLHNSRRTFLVLLSSSLWVTHPMRMGFDFMVTAAPFTILLQLLLCLWTWGISFWWVPASSCRWLFNSQLWFWCSLQEEMSTCPSAPPPWTNLQHHLLNRLFFSYWMSWHPCWKSIDHSFMDLLLNSQFYSIHPEVCPYAGTTLVFDYCSFVKFVLLLQDYFGYPFIF